MSKMPGVADADEGVTLRKVLEERSDKLTEQEIWAITKETCLSLHQLRQDSTAFQLLCITPDTLTFDSGGNVCFLQAAFEADPMFQAPEYEAVGNTVKTHVYSVGMTAWLALQYGGVTGSPSLRRLLADMTSEVSEERPSLDLVIQECERELHGMSADIICNEIAASARWDSLMMGDTDSSLSHTSQSDGSSIDSHSSPFKKHLPQVPPLPILDSINSHLDSQSNTCKTPKCASLYELDMSEKSVVRCTAECLALLREMCSAALAWKNSCATIDIFEQGLSPEHILLWDDGHVTITNTVMTSSNSMTAPEFTDQGKFVWDKSVVYNIGALLCHVIDVDEGDATSPRPDTELGPRNLTESTWRLLMATCRDQPVMRPNLRQITTTCDDLEASQSASYKEIVSKIFARCIHHRGSQQQTGLQGYPLSKPIARRIALPPELLQDIRQPPARLRRCPWPKESSVYELYLANPLWLDGLAHVVRGAQSRTGEHYRPITKRGSMPTLHSVASQRITPASDRASVTGQVQVSAFAQRTTSIPSHLTNTQSAFQPVGRSISTGNTSTSPPNLRLPQPHSPGKSGNRSNTQQLPSAFTSPLTHFRPIVIRSDKEVRPTLNNPTLEDMGRKLATRLRQIKAQTRRPPANLLDDLEGDASLNQTQFQAIRDQKTDLLQLLPQDGGGEVEEEKPPSYEGHWLLKTPPRNIAGQNSSGTNVPAARSSLDWKSAEMSQRRQVSSHQRRSSGGQPMSVSFSNVSANQLPAEPSDDSRDSGVSTQYPGRHYPTPMERLLSVDSLRYQETLTKVIRIVQEEFVDHNIFNSGMEDLSLAEYIASLVRLSWPTFCRAIRERHANLSWPLPLLSRLYTVINGGPPPQETSDTDSSPSPQPGTLERTSAHRRPKMVRRPSSPRIGDETLRPSKSVEQINKHSSLHRINTPPSNTPRNLRPRSLSETRLHDIGGVSSPRSPSSSVTVSAGVKTERADEEVRGPRVAAEFLGGLRASVVYYRATMEDYLLHEVSIGPVESGMNLAGLNAKLAQNKQHISTQMKQRSKTATLRQRMAGITRKKSKREPKNPTIQFLKDLKEMDQSLETLIAEKEKYETMKAELDGIDLQRIPSLFHSVQTDTLHLTEGDVDSCLQFHKSQNMSALQAGLPDALIACLFAKNAILSGYIHAFFFGYRFFVSPGKLLAFLCSVARLAAEYMTSKERAEQSDGARSVEDDVEMCIKLIHRAALLFTVWIEGYYSVDFSERRELAHTLSVFLKDELCPHLNEEEASGLLKLLDACSKGNQSELFYPLCASDIITDSKTDSEHEIGRTVDLSRCLSRSCPLPDNQRSPIGVGGWEVDPKQKDRLVFTGLESTKSKRPLDSFSLSDHSSSTLALALTQLEQDLFAGCRINPVHFLSDPNATDASAASEALRVTAAPLKAWMQHSQRVSHWATAEVVMAGNSKSQIMVITRLLGAARCCLELGNLSSFAALVDGLQSPRLAWAPAWSALPTKWTALREHLSEVRVRLSSPTALPRLLPTLPCPGEVLLIVRQEERGSFLNTAGMVKWAKIRRLAHLIDQIRLAQQFRYPSNPQLSGFIQTLSERITQLPSLNLDTLQAQSTTLLTGSSNLSGLATSGSVNSSGGRRSFLKKMKKRFHKD